MSLFKIIYFSKVFNKINKIILIEFMYEILVKFL